MDLLQTKPIEEHAASSLKQCLTATDLILMGIGAIIGAGVFVLTGVAAATDAGPAIGLSYVLSGAACLFAALSYAELAASIGGCGSAYAYAYASVGELFAWIIGWALLLEYTMAVSTVAIGWSGYVNNALQSLGFPISPLFLKGPLEGGIINLPAFLIIALLSTLLSMGVKASARFNAVIVLIKLLTIGVFIVIASQHINPALWHPYAPFGWEGVVSGAALVFFAYIGFDALSTAAEETINPGRNLPIGIITSLIICTIIYVIVSTLLTGIAHYSSLNVPSPVADALIQLGYRFAAGIIAAGAIAGLTTVMLVMYFGLTRILYAMTRDGLLPPFFARVHPKTQTPVLIIILSGIVIALIAGFVPLSDAATLVNIGTLFAFTFVCAGVIILRTLKPALPRPFKLPWNPFIPFLGILFCVYLMVHLPDTTWKRFFTWLILGIIVYFSYSYRNSVLRRKLRG